MNSQDIYKILGLVEASILGSWHEVEISDTSDRELLM
jgi:hypothetical protein